jgi:hypothetical protein
VELGLFDQVADLLVALTPDELGELRVRAHRRGIKVWFDSATAPREHYEAQLLSRRHVDGRDGMALEVGFHSEHPDAERNRDVVKALAATEPTWRKALGPEAEVADFFGSDTWRRLSEAWIEPDLDDPELAFEIAGRMVDYLTEIEAARRRGQA